MLYISRCIAFIANFVYLGPEFVIWNKFCTLSVALLTVQLLLL